MKSDRAANSWAYVEFPYDLKELYGKGNLVPVIIRFDDQTYRGSVAKMGGKYPMLLIKKDILDKLGKTVGEDVLVTVTLDESPRVVEIPDELKAQFVQNKSAKEAYEKMAYSHRREFSEWISSAKKVDTREERAKKAIEMILSKQKRS